MAQAILLDIDGTLIDNNALHVLAWQRAFRRAGIHLDVPTILHKLGMGGDKFVADVLDELVQETYLKLCADQCRLLRGFQSRHPGSIFGYLKVVTANVVHDYFKSAHSSKRGAGQPGEALNPDCAAADRRRSGVGSSGS